MKTTLFILVLCLTQTTFSQRKYWEFDAFNNVVLRNGFSKSTNDFIRENPNNVSVLYYGGSVSRNLFCIGNLNIGLGVLVSNYSHTILDYYGSASRYFQYSFNGEATHSPLKNPYDFILDKTGYGLKLNIKYRNSINRNNNYEIGLKFNLTLFNIYYSYRYNLIATNQTNNYVLGNEFYQNYNQAFNLIDYSYQNIYDHFALELTQDLIHMTNGRNSIGFAANLGVTIPTFGGPNLHGMVYLSLGVNYRFYNPKYKKKDFFRDKFLDKDLFKKRKP